MRSVRSVVRPLIAVFLALSCVVLSCVVLAAATAQASVQKIQQPSARTDRADTHSLAVSITGITPRQYATAKTSTVTVSGTLTNHTGSTIRDIQVQLQWYPLTFLTRSGMDSFASGGPVSLQDGPVTLQTVGDTSLSKALANGATTHWTVSFNLSQAFLQLGAAQIRYPDIEQNAPWLALVGQMIEQLLGRRIGRDGITGLLQASFDGGPEGCIIIDDVNGPCQLPLRVRRQEHQ